MRQEHERPNHRDPINDGRLSARVSARDFLKL